LSQRELEQSGEPEPRPNTKIPAIPNPELLKLYHDISPELPGLILADWKYHHRIAFLYAMTALIIGGAVALGLIAGFVYLVHIGYPAVATLLLGGGALSIVAGFRSTRL